jgi:hypothetical protein
VVEREVFMYQYYIEYTGNPKIYFVECADITPKTVLLDLPDEGRTKRVLKRGKRKGRVVYEYFDTYEAAHEAKLAILKSGAQHSEAWHGLLNLFESFNQVTAVAIKEK